MRKCVTTNTLAAMIAHASGVKPGNEKCGRANCTTAAAIGDRLCTVHRAAFNESRKK